MSDTTSAGRFPPGKSGNPKGRPKKGAALTDLLRMKGEDADVTIKDPETGETRVMTRKEALADKMWRAALAEPNGSAARYIFDRLDGKPVETHRLKGGGKDGAFVVKFDKDYDGA